MNGLMSEKLRFTRVMNAQAAGTSTIDGTGVDMTLDGGYDGVLFVALIGTLTAGQVTKIKASMSEDNSSFEDILGSGSAAMADGDSNKLLVLDVFRPGDQYVRPSIVRGTQNAVIDGVVAIQYAGHKAPSVQPSSVSALKALLFPTEGTA